MSKYTVELVFWNPVITQVTVEAHSVAEACQKAGEEADWDCSRTCYDACTDTKVSMIARGSDRNLYANGVRLLNVPKEFADPLMTS